MSNFQIKKEMNAGEFITFLSIVGSAISIVWSWNSDRDLRIRENADRIRVEAATVSGKLKRVHDIYMSFYDEIQSDVVEVSELLASSQNTMKARDLLWKRFQQRKAETDRRILDEQLETAYTGLLAFDNSIDSLYNQSMSRLRKLNTNELKLLLTEVESAVLEFKSGKVEQTAVLGNLIRGRIADYKESHEALIQEGIAPLNKHLKELIASPDKALLNH